MTTNLRDLALRPRAVALLVALRKGPRSIGSLADAIGDTLVAQTRELCRLLAEGAVDCRCLVRIYEGRSVRETYGLTHDGLGWLQSQGLDATETAKQALYAATDAQPAAQPCSNPGCSHVDDPAHPAGHICPQPAAARAVRS